LLGDSITYGYGLDGEFNFESEVTLDNISNNHYAEVFITNNREEVIEFEQQDKLTFTLGGRYNFSSSTNTQ
jgi:hypothetical protein